MQGVSCLYTALCSRCGSSWAAGEGGDVGTQIVGCAHGHYRMPFAAWRVQQPPQSSQWVTAHRGPCTGMSTRACPSRFDPSCQCPPTLTAACCSCHPCTHRLIRMHGAAAVTVCDRTHSCGRGLAAEAAGEAAVVAQVPGATATARATHIHNAFEGECR